MQVILKKTILINKNTIIELLYDDELVSQATDLYESNAISDLVSLDGNIYVCKVKDGKIYEVEIQSPFAKKQKASCDCTFFLHHNICKHVVAGLILIRAEQQNKLAIKEQKAKDQLKQKVSTLNISQMLEEISHDELKSFVKSYTKKDIKFATQFKVNFARKIDTKDNAEKYKNILNAVVRPHTGEHTKANSSDIKAALRVLEDFADQINDCIALKQFREAFDIFMAAFSKLEYLRHYYTYHSENLTILSNKYHQSISYFLKEKLPPELRSDLINFLNDLAFRSYYHYTDINFNIVKQLMSYIKPIDNIAFRQNLEKLLKERPSKEWPILLALWLIDHGKYTDECWQFIKEFTLQHIEMVDQLLAANEEQLALKVLESMYHPKKINKDVVNRLVFLYVRFKKINKLIETTGLAYLHSGDLKYIDVLKRELSDMEYYQFIEQFEEELINKKADPNLLIKIYRKEENWSGLLLFLDKTNDLELVMQYDSLLYKYEKTALAQLYIHQIKTYLDEHLGDSAFEYLKKLKDHFTNQKMDNVLFKVKMFISESYEHRPKVVEIFS